MKNRRLTMMGVAVMLLGGILLAAQSFAPGGGVTSVLAGNQTPDPTSPPQTTATAPRVVRTATPVFTSTSLPATSTPVPPTQSAPTSAPPTQPSSGNEGAAIQPPNTGTGGGSGTDYGFWLMLLGGVAIAAGSGAVLAGSRRR